MDSAMRNALEQYADALESVARTPMYKEHAEKIDSITNGKCRSNLYTIAWELKQIARFGTSSFGV